jgi:type I restriction enzyme M protein
MPFTLLRRLEGALEATNANVLAEHDKVQQMGLPEEAQELVSLALRQ